MSRMVNKMNIKQLVESIEKRPLMFMEEKNVTYLYYIIWGYMIGKGGRDNNCDIDIRFRDEFSPWLRKQLKKHNKNYDYENYTWNKALESITNTSQEAFDMFFSAFWAFFEEQDHIEDGSV